MKTLIFVPLSDDVSGFMDLYENNHGIKIKYAFNLCKNEEHIMYKLYGLSAKKPMTEPLIIDTVEFKDGYSSAEKNITYAMIEERGYFGTEIDTFVLVKKNIVTSEVTIAAKCFLGLVWNADSAFELKTEIDIANPIQRGIEALEHLKERTATKDLKKYLIWHDKIKKSLKKYEPVKSDISDKYVWYKINSVNPPVDLSSYKHLLFVSGVMEIVYKKGYYLFGYGLQGHTAFALEFEGDVNPFVNADDCSEKIGNFYTVGVFLAEDGQYFEKIDKSN